MSFVTIYYNVFYKNLCKKWRRERIKVFVTL